MGGFGNRSDDDPLSEDDLRALAAKHGMSYEELIDLRQKTSHWATEREEEEVEYEKARPIYELNDVLVSAAIKAARKGLHVMVKEYIRIYEVMMDGRYGEEKFEKLTNHIKSVPEDLIDAIQIAVSYSARIASIRSLSNKEDLLAFTKRLNTTTKEPLKEILRSVCEYQIAGRWKAEEFVSTEELSRQIVGAQPGEECDPGMLWYKGSSEREGKCRSHEEIKKLKIADLLYDFEIDTEGKFMDLYLPFAKEMYEADQAAQSPKEI